MELMVNDMKIKDNININEIVKIIQDKKNLTEKCVLSRMYLSPQSTHLERIVKNDLGIKNAINNLSGDGCKRKINYEIKISIHSKKCKLNFVQLRPDHNIDFYILIYYNMYYNNQIGKAYIFKIPTNIMYDLIIKYGGYAHGTCNKLGRINSDNLKGRNCEYSLRCSPNINSEKNIKIWNELLKYEVDYNSKHF